MGHSNINLQSSNANLIIIFLYVEFSNNLHPFAAALIFILYILDEGFSVRGIYLYLRVVSLYYLYVAIFSSSPL